MWAFDRRTGEVREVASFDPGAQHALGSASDVSLLGDRAAWAAPVVLGPDTFGSRIYVADLRAGTVRRLDEEANYPSLVSPGEIGAAMRTVVTDPATGDGLAQPVTISLPGGTATPEDWVAPATILAAAASPAGAVVVRLLKNLTADDTTVKADVVARYPTGQTRTFGLPGQLGPRWRGSGVPGLERLPPPLGPALRAARADAGRRRRGRRRLVLHQRAGALLAHDRRATSTYDWSTGRLARVTCP